MSEQDIIEDPEAETTPRRDRRVKNSPLTSYIWEQVPRQLVADAKAKANREGTSIKHTLIRLLRDWTYTQEAQP